ncbi:MAG: putative Ig domain-containing protein, partial [Polyangiaceae bacterium]
MVRTDLRVHAHLNYPSSFLADGLPDGLSVNATNGLIQGTPLVNGTFTVVLG